MLDAPVVVDSKKHDLDPCSEGNYVAMITRFVKNICVPRRCRGGGENEWL